MGERRALNAPRAKDSQRATASGPVPLEDAEQARWDESYADWEWVSTHPEALEPYRGQYVAVLDRRVVAHGEDAGALRRSLEASGHRDQALLMLRVPSADETEGILAL